MAIEKDLWEQTTGAIDGSEFGFLSPAWCACSIGIVFIIGDALSRFLPRDIPVKDLGDGGSVLARMSP
jgi:hypothetical protein